MSSPEEVIDPVCGMTIAKNKAPISRSYTETTFYLCSLECGVKFDADADAYVAASRAGLPGWGQTPHPESVTRQFRPDV